MGGKERLGAEEGGRSGGINAAQRRPTLLLMGWGEEEEGGARVGRRKAAADSNLFNIRIRALYKRKSFYLSSLSLLHTLCPHGSVETYMGTF